MDIFFFITFLLIPMAMIGLGILMKNKPPKTINGFYGYRTPMSMKNQETWNFAHKHVGKVWVIAGSVLLPASAITYFFVRSEDMGVSSSIVVSIHCIGLLLSIIPTEVALHKRFDREGNRKD